MYTVPVVRHADPGKHHSNKLTRRRFHANNGMGDVAPPLEGVDSSHRQIAVRQLGATDVQEIWLAQSHQLPLFQRHFNTLIGATVHEMRNVLTALKEDNAQILRHEADGHLSIAYLHRKSCKIADHLDFLERLLSDMRNFTLPISGERICVAVSALLKEAYDIVLLNFKAKHIPTRKVILHMRVSHDLVVDVSRVHVVAAIVNVLKNAFEFLIPDEDGPVGRINVHARRCGQRIHIAIQDNGQGIPAAELDTIRLCLPGRTSRFHVGTGFGLCNAKRFIEAHSGRLQIDSKENHGTKVTLILPVVE